MANQTINGVNTEVILKTCKDGYLFEINALTGNLIWAWDPPAGTENPGPTRCPICYPFNPLNASMMDADFPTAVTNCAPTWTLACESGAQPPFLQWPSELAGFEDEQAFDPANNLIYATSHVVPFYMGYLGLNSSTYFSSTGEGSVPCPNCGTLNDNATTWAINAATGTVQWHHQTSAIQGYRGQTDVSGNVVYTIESSGDILMVDATTGQLIRDYYIGAPMDIGVTIGASVNGQEYILTPVGGCGYQFVGCVSSVGDIVALTLSNVPPPSTSTSTATSTSTTTVTATSTTTSVSVSASTTTTVSTVVSTSSTGVSSTALYGVAAVAVIFIIVSGYLAMRGRKPAS